MTQKEKELLLKDLGGRLFTGVILKQYNCINNYINDCGDTTDISLSEMIIPIFERGFLSFRPYLRPLSSMTKKEQRYIWDTYGPSFLVADFEDVGDVSELFKFCQMNISRAHYFVDWLNAHYFDYLGLIEKGLALEAPENMYTL